MYIKLIPLLVILLAQFYVFAGNVKVYPTPQSMKSTGKSLNVGADIVFIGEDKADTEAVKQFRQLFSVTDSKEGYKVYIGEQDDSAVQQYVAELKKSNPDIMNISGGYYLSVRDDRMVIVGFDERGTFYAIQTLAQLKDGDTLPEVEIIDYPEVAYRGVVEGFYGQPWSYEDRVSQLAFYGQHKLNVYIYGPKDDPYHSSPDWRKPYPEKEAGEISRLVKLSKASKVDFVWAIHPGQDIKWNDEDRQALIGKFEQMYVLGVRSFAVFFDDISGEGTDPLRQAELMNFIDDRFVAAKPDVTPLIVCPTEYNKSWANPKPGGYLDILGDKLNKSIMVMWTGDRVVADITSEGLDWVNPRIKRLAYVWWNFPVNDYVRDHLLMGPAYGLASDAGRKMSAFVSNPMEKAEASKIAIACIADYSWYPAVYDYKDSWEHAIRTIMPQAPEAFRVFAAHNSDMGKNGHKYRRDESVDIKPVIEKFLAEYRQGNVQEELSLQVTGEFQKIKAAPALLLATSNNPALIEEIRPWLEQFEVLGEAGGVAVKSVSFDLAGDITRLWEQYCRLLQLDIRRDNIDRHNNQNPYQPGIKTGSLVMQPFVDTVSMIASEHLYKHFSGQASNVRAMITAPVLYTNVGQLKNLQLQMKEQTVAITPILEVVRMQPQEYIGIELPVFTGNVKVLMDLNAPAAGKWGVVKVSKDGKDWKKVKVKMKGTEITVPVLEERIRYVAFMNPGEEMKEVYLKKFVVSSDELSTGENNQAYAQDGDLKTVYKLGSEPIMFRHNAAVDSDISVSVLAEPQTDINVTVMAIDRDNRGHELGTMNMALTTFYCPPGTQAIRLVSNGSVPVNIHEIIWK